MDASHKKKRSHCQLRDASSPVSDEPSGVSSKPGFLHLPPRKKPHWIPGPLTRLALSSRLFPRWQKTTGSAEPHNCDEQCAFLGHNASHHYVCVRTGALHWCRPCGALSDCGETVKLPEALVCRISGTRYALNVDFTEFLGRHCSRAMRSEKIRKAAFPDRQDGYMGYTKPLKEYPFLNGLADRGMTRCVEDPFVDMEWRRHGWTDREYSFDNEVVRAAQAICQEVKRVRGDTALSQCRKIQSDQQIKKVINRYVEERVLCSKLVDFHDGLWLYWQTLTRLNPPSEHHVTTDAERTQVERLITQTARLWWARLMECSNFPPYRYNPVYHTLVVAYRLATGYNFCGSITLIQRDIRVRGFLPPLNTLHQYKNSLSTNKNKPYFVQGTYTHHEGLFKRAAIQWFMEKGEKRMKAQHLDSVCVDFE